MDCKEGEKRFLKRMGKNQAQAIENNLHWYLFVFMTPAGNSFSLTNSTVGYTDQKITKQRIKFVKEEAGLTERSAVISCNYLGFMTQAELNA